MINASEYRDTYLALNLCINARVPVILWGPPGQGKTSVIKAISKKEERVAEVLLASIREPQDFSGLPSIVNGRATLVAPDWALRLADDGNGILFLDEINTAPPAVQAALLRVCLDKVAGDCDLGEATSIVAAANPPEQAADGWDLAAPLANRFCHLDWQLPNDVVRSGLAGEWPTYKVPEVNPSAIEEVFIQEKILLAGFLTSRSDLTTALPKHTSEQGRAFPTPRSWETLALLSAWVTVSGLDESIRRVIARGTVGQGAGTEFITYRANMDLPMPEDVLSNPKKFSLPDRADKVFVIGASVIGAVRRDFTEARWHQAGDVLIKIVKAGHEDIATSLARDWLKLPPKAKKGKTPLLPDPNLMSAIAPLIGETNYFGMGD